MSGTQWTRKIVKTATDQGLAEYREQVERQRAAERNNMVRAGLSQRLEIIDAEIKRRGVPCPLCNEPIEPGDKTDPSRRGPVHHNCPDTLA